LKRLAHGIEISNIVTLKSVADAFETLHRFLVVLPFSASKANIGRYRHCGSIFTAAKQFFGVFFHHFPAANGAFLGMNWVSAECFSKYQTTRKWLVRRVILDNFPMEN